jgi:hypothetical protein
MTSRVPVAAGASHASPPSSAAARWRSPPGGARPRPPEAPGDPGPPARFAGPWAMPAPGPRPTERQAAPASAGRGLPARQVALAAADPAGPGGRRRAVVAVAAAAGVLVASLVVAACQWSAGELGAKAAGPAPGTRARVAARAARPVSIAIPAAGVDARVVPVGLRPDGAMEVPEVDRAGWYRLGPRPGSAARR